MTVRQLWGIVLLLLLGVGLGYTLGTWYFAPRIHHSKIVIMEGV
jgi:hypothetical protein